MKVTIKLFASLRKGRFDREEREYMEGVKVIKVMNKLNISKDQVAVIFVNSRRVGLGKELFEGDVLSFFPLVGGG